MAVRKYFPPAQGRQVVVPSAVFLKQSMITVWAAVAKLFNTNVYDVCARADKHVGRADGLRWAYLDFTFTTQIDTIYWISS